MALDMLSSYRVMWLLCMFDLPVVEAEQRHRAQKFREGLLDLGFEMTQFSVYTRHCTSETAPSWRARIKERVPVEGRVQVITFTDAQFERMEIYYGGKKKPPAELPQQAMFW